MLKKAIISGIIFSSILLGGCNGEPEVVILDDSNSENEGNDTILSPESNFLSQLKNDIIVSITEQTELDSESVAIMLGGNPSEEMTISVGFPKDEKIDDTIIQQVIEDSIAKVSETENITISQENIIIQIEEY